MKSIVLFLYTSSILFADDGPTDTFFNINSWKIHMENQGFFSYNGTSHGSAGNYPKGMGNVIFSEGILWGAKVTDKYGVDANGVILTDGSGGGTPRIRVNGSMYNTGLKAGKVLRDANGKILSQNYSENYRTQQIWRVRKDWNTADLRGDIAILKDADDPTSLTDAQIAAGKAQYEHDWKEWPADEGAPYDDVDNNGTYTAATWNGTSIITAYASDVNGIDSTSFTLTVIAVNDAPVMTAVANDTIPEDSDGKVIKLSASDIEGDALTYSGIADTSAVTVTLSNDTLKLIPQANWNGSSMITAIVSDGIASDSTIFTLTVTSVNDAPSLIDTTFNEDTSISIMYTIQSGVTLGAKADTSAIKFSISNDSLNITPDTNYFGSFAVTLTAYEGAVALDSTFFTVTVKQIQDKPYPFEWVSTSLDTIDITQSNLADIYELKWSESKDVDGETINYLLYARTGVNPAQEVYDTTSTSLPIPYQEFLQKTFEQIPMLSRATVKFSVSATDGIDTVKVTGDDRVVFVNRYEYLSTADEGIPTEFALHDNYPNPFNPTTTLRFDLPELSDVNVVIYNMLGQKVKSFNMQSTPAGYHSLTWNATNDYGDPVSAGVYLYQLQAKDFVKTRKMVLLK